MELLDIYDNNAKRTGRTIIRGDKTAVLSKDEHIAVAVIFIENSDGQFLMQKTSAEKGGKYSSTGGHLNSGETALETIKREVMEELNLDIYKDNIIDLGYLLYDQPLRYVFYLKKDVNINELKLQLEEVESVQYVSVEEVMNMIEQDTILKSHGILFEHVLKYLNQKER